MRPFVYLLLYALCSAAGAASAQVALTITAPDTVDPGATLAVDVAVSGFTAITSAQFEIAWDESVFRVESVEVPVDSFATNSPFMTATRAGSAAFLYVEQTATVGGTLADGAVLLRINLRAVGQRGEMSCFDVSTDRIGVEFIERAQTELTVTVAKASVHLSEPVSTSSQEQPKFSPRWHSAVELGIVHDARYADAGFELYDLLGRRLSQTQLRPSNETTILRLASPAAAKPHVLVVLRGGVRHTLLIPGRY